MISISRLLSAADRAVNNLSSKWTNYYLRQDDKKIFETHKHHWTFLTPSELRSIDARDKYAYAIYKNMAGAENLPYYVSAAVYKSVLLPILNPLNHTPSGHFRASIFADKNYSELFMPGLRFPKVILRRMCGQFYDADMHRITLEQAQTLVAPYSELVFKQSTDSGHGRGVCLVSASDFETALVSHANDYVVQEKLLQHEHLAYFNESSVNILRVTSICLNGEIYILGGIFRIGAPGSFHDHKPHGNTHNLDIRVNHDGTLANSAYDPDHCHVYDNVYGKPIFGSFPRYHEILDLIRQEHIKHPHFGLIGWDFTIDRDENIICMEFNTKWPGISATQYAHGPVLAQKTKDGIPLLDAILKKGSST